MHKDTKRKRKNIEPPCVGYRDDLENMPVGPTVSVLTRAANIRGCRLIDGVPHYRSVHGEWFDARKWDPPVKWWDGPVPGAPTGRYYYPEQIGDLRKSA